MQRPRVQLVAAAVSTSLPRYITPMRVLTYFTTARSWAMKR
jgi:hypothetical protein